MTKATERLERLQQQEVQLKARIQQERAKVSASARKERTGKLVAWGVAVEQLLADDTFKDEWWNPMSACFTGRTLERALRDKPAEE